ncbi:MCE family protein [Brumimicrobium glaciale]|uniref:MCE family protein n=1 Tax=Brumimicrobium glaciale TaxID=200475 RepID=A0A4Q4KRY9_9FLAO|nr:MlaD family protein [Brumimicrobium glaciale]RYM36093.1 MCE family protein [Brumimicrobium glaciale]
MAKSNSQKIKVGIFVIVGTVLLISGLYFIGKDKHMFSKGIQLYAVFDDVKGLQLGNNVRYSGINVGTVSKIEMTEVGKITILISVEEKTAKFIKKDAIASIGSDGLVGSMVVNIIPGKNQQSATVNSGDTINSQNNISTDEMLETLNITNKNVALLSADLLEITKQVLMGEGTIGTLINDTLMAQNIQLSVVELRKTTEATSLAISKINTIISKINYDESAAAVILSDTAAANQMRSIFTSLEKSSKDVNQVTKNLNEYIIEIKNGKGAINHLTQDEDLVREIDSTMIDIKESADKLNKNMEALKHSFLFRRYFKKQEKKNN